MKITDVKLRFAKHYLFVQIYTDAGITGLGEAAPPPASGCSGRW